MTGFSDAWLALRKPFDAAARDDGLTAKLVDWAAPNTDLAVVDLGSGTGSNRRWLQSRLRQRQRWTLMEHDPALIQAGTALLTAGDSASYRQLDLATDLDAAFEPPVDLVTCSALLDLASASWLDRLARLLGHHRPAFLAVLTYDGRIDLAPHHALDATVIGLVNRHQRIDKGFGPAMGPDATRYLLERLAGIGGTVRVARSDWQCGNGDRAIQSALVEGWADAAAGMDAEAADEIRDWRRDRLACVDSGKATAAVGHLDLLWLPD